MTADNLTPEQRKAIKVLQECLPLWQEYLCYDITERDICYTDFRGFTLQKLSYSDLQHGTNWTWNQSNSKKKVLLENDISVVVQKFNTRKKRKNIPSNGLIFKMWMFTVYKHSQNSFLGVFVWCEKGLPAEAPVPSVNKIPVISQASSDYPCEEYPIYDDLYPLQNNYPIFPAFALEESFVPGSNGVETITLEDLQFLRPFVDSQTAYSLGW